MRAAYSGCSVSTGMIRSSINDRVAAPDPVRPLDRGHQVEDRPLDRFRQFHANSNERIALGRGEFLGIVVIHEILLEYYAYQGRAGSDRAAVPPSVRC